MQYTFIKIVEEGNECFSVLFNPQDGYVKIPADRYWANVVAEEIANGLNVTDYPIEGEWITMSNGVESRDVFCIFFVDPDFPSEKIYVPCHSPQEAFHYACAHDFTFRL